MGSGLLMFVQQLGLGRECTQQQGLRGAAAGSSGTSLRLEEGSDRWAASTRRGCACGSHGLACSSAAGGGLGRWTVSLAALASILAPPVATTGWHSHSLANGDPEGK